MTAALCRKRPSPLTSGKPSTWACAILYALDQVNFLFDRTQTPHLTPKELCAGFGVSTSTAVDPGQHTLAITRRERANSSSTPRMYG
jgi:hypothetical protein